VQEAQAVASIARHCPLQQRWPIAAQFTPHAPQLGSASVATQEPPQHSSPGSHAVVQFPQCDSSVIVFTQSGMQQVMPAVQVIKHPVQTGSFGCAQVELQHC
jgi:hypothetical protein